MIRLKKVRMEKGLAEDKDFGMIKAAQRSRRSIPPRSIERRDLVILDDVIIS